MNILFFDISLNVLALALSIGLTALSQVLLRQGARNKTGFIATVFNARTCSGYALFLAVVLLMIYALQQIPLRTAMTWTASTYILTPLVAHRLLNDPFSKKMLGGICLIMLGIIVFSL